MYRLLHASDVGYTFPTGAPHARLDYVFVPTAFKNRIRECEVFTQPAAATASDHLPLFAEIAT